uniref:Ig-like domain-containing protein n=1 Tax=Parascaris univalens TaxID=6257 RepID=A0A915A5Z0_PARUN
DLLCAFFPIARAKDSRSELEKEEYNSKLHRFYRCMQIRDERNQSFVNVRAIIVIRDAELNMRCFDCLSPEEQNEVEEIWKPNESFLGKKAHQIFDKIKEVCGFFRSVIQ